MNPTPGISVAVTTCNRAHYLRDCLQSICTQTLLPTEIIVSEDGADSETRQVIEQCAQEHRHITIVHIVNDPPLGQLANRQQAITSTSCEYVAMLDDDDIWYAKFLEVHYRHLLANPSCGFSCSNHSFMNEKGVDQPAEFERFQAFSGRDQLQTAVYNDVFIQTITNKACLFCIIFCLYRRSVLEQVGFFQSYGGLVPDLALMLSLGAHRVNAVYIDRILGSSRMHGGQQSNKRLENSISKVEALQEIRTRHKTMLTGKEQKMLRKQLTQAVIECAIAYAHSNRKQQAARLLLQIRGVSAIPLKRLVVLLALLMGARKRSRAV
ncbi:glycosyltransferase family A protein [Paenibacillus sp. NEAU-GSW1]|uniref:glycosyltransferase family 2 protein n=1 Tax=Paenibacillus sp. NEAU-GSW1 TaxID=2682486 RepID=UPI0012E27694|nr:glycosyltransferase family A protein [Paenibacillus sp. NEAU-GSW1]MUT64607.1 glycosyltransferase [Paenibacillus sp. NEAU-GSW1]